MSEPHDIVPEGIESLDDIRSRQATPGESRGSKRRRCEECELAALEPRTGSIANSVAHDYYCSYCKEARSEQETFVGEVDL